AKHRLTLLPGLKDVTGRLVSAPGWHAEFTTRPFDVTTDFTERERLEIQPQVSLDCTYDVQLSDVAEHVYFQDRDTRERFPVDVIVWSRDNAPAQMETKSFSVAPRKALAQGHTFDLVVNGLLEAKSRKPLAYLKVFAVGTT